MKILVALGGNALLKRGEPMDASTQFRNVQHAATALVQLIGAGHELIITHGNGPQVGLLALQAEAGPDDGRYPLDILGAESQGMIGYMLEQAMRNLLPKGTILATVLTQTRVDATDVAFSKPTKPIGPVYDEATARTLERERGWTCVRDGAAWRRAVASPEPLDIIELPAIRLLQRAGAIVICAGGGGIPVVARSNGHLAGIEAVIDKDKASQMLAQALSVDLLLMLTDVDAVYVSYGENDARSIVRMGPDPDFANALDAGSMGPKVEAATRFAIDTGRDARIGRTEDALAIVQGMAGTIVQALDVGTEYRV
ncbi:carbamate kinase [Devosia sp.]|uniref:carbamate kinase n=1 Tax=Devosia sp. TaxID=1871048 RepID=UPI003267B9BB